MTELVTKDTAVETAGPYSGSRLQRALRTWTAPGKVFYLSTMTANAVGYLFFFIMARALSVAEYGELVTLTALVYVFGVITRSMQAKAAQAVSVLRAADMPADSAASLALRQMLRPLLAGTLVLLLLGLVVSPPVAQFLKLESPGPVILLSAYVASHFLLSGPRGLLLGAGRLYYLSWVTVLDPLVRLLVAVLLIGGTWETSGALLGYVAGNMAAAGMAALPYLRRPAHRPLAPPRPAPARLTFDRNFLFALFVNSALMVLAGVDPVAIRRFFSEQTAGTYAAAFLLGRIILLSTNALSWVIFSRAVQHRPNDPRARRVLVRGLLLGGATAGAVTAAYWIAPDLAVRALGGSAFAAASDFVGLVGLEMLLFTVVSLLAYYHIAIRNTRVALPFALALVLEVSLLAAFHATPYHILYDTMATLGFLLVWLAAETVRAMRAAPAAAPPPRACMVVHSHYPADPRVRRETEALLADGWQVDVICVPDEDETARYEVVNGARVFRMPLRRNRQGSQASYLAEYGRFFITASLTLLRLHLRRPYDVVQVHNMPDFLVFTALVPRLLGARVVLDVHDLVPEFYALRYGLPDDHWAVRLTRWVQRLSTRFASHVITAGEPFRRQLAANGLSLERVTSIMNSPDPALFGRPTASHNGHGHPNSRFVLAYHGTLSEYTDLTLVLRVIDRLRGEIPGLEFHVYGRGRALPQLKALAAELQLNEHVKFMGFRPLDEMPAAIGGADLGVVPQCRSRFTALNFPTKAFEYIALGVPVLLSRSTALNEIFGHVDGIFFEPDSVDELAALIRRLHADRERRQAIVSQQQAVCARFAWEAERQRYVAVMRRLLRAVEPRLEPAAGV